MFSNNLKKLRMEKNLTQKELGEATSIGRKTISDYERGISNPDLQTVKVIADFFNVSSDYLLGLSDVRENVAINNFTEHLEGIDIEILKDIKSLNDKAKEDLKTILQYLKNKGDIKK